MASPLFAVLLFQILVAIINAIGQQTINETAWHLWNIIPLVPKSSTTEEELRLRGEILRKQEELNATSMQDDFAKWARLRRQLDKLQESYKQLTSAESESKTAFIRSIYIIRTVGINGFRFYIQWHYTRQPMYWLPKGWIPWYGEWILSFPYAPRGSVSVQVWQMACGTIISCIVEALSAVVALYTGKTSSSRHAEQSLPVPSNGQAAKPKAL